MKKLIYISAWLLFSSQLYAKTIRVGQQQTITSIQQALNQAANGDTILVDAGHYHEKNLIINRTVFLIGTDHPVLDGDHTYEIISIKANGVVVDGFKIVHSGISSIEDFAGIKIYSSRDVVIRNNILEDTFFGIY
ncbi:MAG: nitrous oxide reductase family maturation protein NosD, partial [Ferruginibacter sp.]